MEIAHASKPVKAVQVNIFSSLMLKSLHLNKFKLKKTPQEYQKEKRSILEELIRDSLKNCGDTINVVSRLLDEAYTALITNGYMPYNVTAKTASRLIVHTKSPFGNFAFEVGLAFHPILNVPYIPASCIKGAIRAYVEVNELVSDPTQIFGAAGTETGKILVTDAFPLKWNNVLLEPEVTTPIYRDSAKEHEASPTPIIYLTIARNVTFRFIVAMRDVSKEQEHAIKNWIQAALKEGLGSKTMLGYGRMEGRLP